MVKCVIQVLFEDNANCLDNGWLNNKTLVQELLILILEEKDMLLSGQSDLPSKPGTFQFSRGSTACRVVARIDEEMK